MFIKTLLGAMKSTASSLASALSPKERPISVSPQEMHPDDYISVKLLELNPTERAKWTEEQIRALRSLQPKINNFVNSPHEDLLDF